MLSEKQRHFKTMQAISLEALVPPDNFYRQVETRLDLRFVRELVAECYTRVGRPSINPVVFFKLHLIMFLEGIRSERQLMETVNLNLAHRWYIGYDLDEAVPDHSSLSKIRDRYGLEVFQHFFERIIELCQQAGLVWGKELYFDGMKVQANAAADRLEPRLKVVQHHLEEWFPQPPLRSEHPSLLVWLPNTMVHPFCRVQPLPATTALLTKPTTRLIPAPLRCERTTASQRLWVTTPTMW
jgi:transposase